MYKRQLFTWVLYFRVDSGFTRTRFLLVTASPSVTMCLFYPALVMVTILVSPD